MDPLNIKIAELREALESITAEQKYLKARDARHRYSKFATFSTKHRFGLSLRLYRLSFFFFFCVLCVLTANVSTKKRVIYFTLAEYIVFAAASALQVVYIRNLFSKTVGYNRV